MLASLVNAHSTSAAIVSPLIKDGYFLLFSSASILKQTSITSAMLMAKRENVSDSEPRMLSQSAMAGVKPNAVINDTASTFSYPPFSLLDTTSANMLQAMIEK